jgi:hypothetical protein
MSQNRPVIIALVVVGLLIIGFIIYSATSSDPQPEVVTQKIAIPVPVPEPVVEEPVPHYVPPPVTIIPVEEEEEEEVAPAFILPLLDNSDQLIRDGVVSLTRHEGINGWLAPNELIRKYVAFVDGIANGQVAKDPVRILAPQGPFLVRQISETVFELDEASYDRYNFFADVVGSLDSRRAAEFYQLVNPMLQEAFEELGYPDLKFNDVVFKAIGRLLETPVINGQIRLVRPVVMYEFEDKKLESLGAAQKQLIRMGPRNSTALKVKLSEIALELRSVLDNS